MSFPKATAVLSSSLRPGRDDTLLGCFFFGAERQFWTDSRRFGSNTDPDRLESVAVTPGAGYKACFEAFFVTFGVFGKLRRPMMRAPLC
jgi:hypothetical protein